MKADTLVSMTGAKGIGVPNAQAKKLDGFAELMKRDRRTQSEIMRLAAAGDSCEAAKEAIGKAINYGEADRRIVVDAHMECLDTKPVVRE